MMNTTLDMVGSHVNIGYCPQGPTIVHWQFKFDHLATELYLHVPILSTWVYTYIFHGLVPTVLFVTLEYAQEVGIIVSCI